MLDNNVILGKKVNMKIASLIDQIERLINYYDTKNLPSCFNSGIK